MYPDGGPLGQMCAVLFFPEETYWRGRFLAKCESGASEELTRSFEKGFPTGEGSYSFTPLEGQVKLRGMAQSGTLTLKYEGTEPLKRTIFSNGNALVFVNQAEGGPTLRIQDTWTEADKAATMCPTQLTAPTLDDPSCTGEWVADKKGPISAEWYAQQCRFDYSCKSSVGKECEREFDEAWIHSNKDDCQSGLRCVGGRGGPGKKRCVPEVEAGQPCGNKDDAAVCARGSRCILDTATTGTCVPRNAL